jgi:hypothetical protein
MTGRTRFHVKAETVAALLVVAIMASVGVASASAATFRFGSCSGSALAAAVAAANANGHDDVIVLAPGCTYTLAAQLEVMSDGGHKLTILGQGATVSGNAVTRVFRSIRGRV